MRKKLINQKKRNNTGIEVLIGPAKASNFDLFGLSNLFIYFQ